eukprot:GHRR01022228.1.p1 GENE.GHRR01022228.1~~GHRR01022228.1.p1  ORF type:complete len:452 (+),score=168.60 GHRR01022228.1:388-1743(+)
MIASVQFQGFKACFGGKELTQACATLSGALIGGKLPAPLDQLSEDSDLHVRELAFAARQYTVATAENPADYDALYNHGVLLQELSGKLPAASADQTALLRQACSRYEAAVAVKPSSHTALYNWAVALSDLARAVRQADPAEATAALHLASMKYAESLQLNPRNPQALNNWGLLLQELSADAGDWFKRDSLVRSAMDKFRLALRSRPDFDRGCYNLGTVFYTFAMALQNTSDNSASRQSHDHSVRTLLAVAAQYICLAHALQPSKDIYRKSLSVVRQMLPLPFLRAGYLTAPRATSLGSVTETYRRGWFVLDHKSLRQASSMETSLSTAAAGVLTTQQRGPAGSPAVAAGAAGSQAAAAENEPLVLPLDQLLAVRSCAEPSLPEGGGIWISTQAIPTGLYLVADDGDGADAWVDALVLCQHLVGSGASEALQEALAPVTARRSKAHTAALAG